MNTRYLLTFVCLLASSSFIAQDVQKISQPLIPKVESSVDFALAGGASVYSAAVGAYRTHGLFAKRKLRVGYGVRLSAFGGSDLDYITAPFELTSDPDKIDTFNVGAPISAGLSANIQLAYYITSKWMVGFNIDAFGLGFGATNIGTFISSDNNGQYPMSVRARPTGYNLLLVGDNDIGQLKSEFVVGYNINEKWRIRAGGDFTFSEYTTVQKLANDNDRFRYKAMMGFIGLSYNFETKYDGGE